MGWYTTGRAAALLGTTTPTIRAMVGDGRLVGESREGRERRTWKVLESSVEAYLVEHGRFEVRPVRRKSADDADLREQFGAMRAELRDLRAQVATDRESSARERAELAAQVTALRDLPLRLRAKADAVQEAGEEQAAAADHLRDALAAQARATDALRRALREQDDALGEFLVPDLPQP